MEPATMLTLGSIGSSILGGLFGSRGEKRQAQLTREQMAMAQRQFDQQMDASIQRRVKDAQKAGIHPLFALGASSGASPTLQAGGSPPQGGAMSAAMAQVAETLGITAANRAAAKRDEAEAALMNAQTAKMGQEMASQGRDVLGAGVRTFPLPDPPTIEGHYLDAAGEPIKGGFEVLPGQVIAEGNVPGYESGVGPAMKVLNHPSGQRIQIYSESAQADELNQALIAKARAQWHAEMKLWQMRRGQGPRAAQARKWLLENTSPSRRAAVEAELERLKNKRTFFRFYREGEQ